MRSVFLIFWLVMSVIGLLTMWSDKRRAKTGRFRIRESVLFAVAFLFGGIGSSIGMVLFRHKTRHWYFVVGLPFFGAVNIVCGILLLQVLPA
jgi:hypothetical protein